MVFFQQGGALLVRERDIGREGEGEREGKAGRGKSMLCSCSYDTYIT